MTAAATWSGRRGTVLLGPTEHRVARYLADATRHGRITVRTVELAATLQLERSEAYRILARLRVLGLFGIENDRGGTRGGRRIWRTSTGDDRSLDPVRHRLAWARVRAWARARARRLVDAIRRRGPGPTAPHRPAEREETRPAGLSFRDGMIRGGLSPTLLERWRLTT